MPKTTSRTLGTFAWFSYSLYIQCRTSRFSHATRRRDVPRTSTTSNRIIEIIARSHRIWYRVRKNSYAHEHAHTHESIQTRAQTYAVFAGVGVCVGIGVDAERAPQCLSEWVRCVVNERACMLCSYMCVCDSISGMRFRSGCECGAVALCDVRRADLIGWVRVFGYFLANDNFLRHLCGCVFLKPNTQIQIWLKSYCQTHTHTHAPTEKPNRPQHTPEMFHGKQKADLPIGSSAERNEGNWDTYRTSRHSVVIAYLKIHTGNPVGSKLFQDTLRAKKYQQQ